MALRLLQSVATRPASPGSLRCQSSKRCAERLTSSAREAVRVVGGGGKRGARSCESGRRLVARAAKEVRVDLKEAGVKGDILPSGEWAENFSLLNYEDLTKHYEPALFKPEAQPSTILAEVMSKRLYIAFPDQALEEVDPHFTEISGIPVVDAEHRCVGVLSKTGRSKASDLKTKVKDVMSSPAITLSADKTVSDAAVLMLKNKIHRIPVVNDQMQVVGIVTRTDIFTALEGGA